MEGGRRRVSRFDAVAALAARALPDALLPMVEQARLDAQMVLGRLSGRSPAPLLDDAASPTPLSQIDPVDLLPRRLAERMQTARRDANMLRDRLLLGRTPSPLIERAMPRPGEVVSLPRQSPDMTRTVSVVKVVRETRDAVSIYLNEKDGSALKFRPGQFLSVDVTIDGERFRRAYSLASACLEGAPTHITVKRIADGRVSNYLNDTIAAGHELSVLGPSGNFTIEPSAVKRRHLVMIAGGSGITPIVSIAETALRVEPSTRITMIYGNRGWDDVIFRDRLARLCEEFGERLRVDHVLEQPPHGWTGEQGLLDSDVLESRMRALRLEDDGMQRYFLCGPSPMMDAAHSVLRSRGVDESRIAEERFTSPESRSGAEGSDTAERVVIMRGGHEHGIIVEPGQSILEAALGAAIEMPYSCAMGGCGACRVHLSEGEVQMEEPNCLSRAERERGYVLTCIGRPLGSVRVEVDPS